MIATVHKQARPIVNVAELSIVIIINSRCTTSFSLNSGVTEPKLTKCTEVIAD